jgi:hypothetical protein
VLGTGSGDDGGDVLEAEWGSGAELWSRETGVLGDKEGICLLCISRPLGVSGFTKWASLKGQWLDRRKGVGLSLLVRFGRGATSNMG